MQSFVITTARIYTNGVRQFRINPVGGVLLFQCYIGGAWITYDSMGEPGNVTNSFRFIAEDSQLKVQQLEPGGVWTGTEGVDFVTVHSWTSI